jgi:hypothetical protein
MGRQKLFHVMALTETADRGILRPNHQDLTDFFTVLAFVFKNGHVFPSAICALKVSEKRKNAKHMPKRKHC